MPTTYGNEFLIGYEVPASVTEAYQVPASISRIVIGNAVFTIIVVRNRHSRFGRSPAGAA